MNQLALVLLIAVVAVGGSAFGAHLALKRRDRSRTRPSVEPLPASEELLPVSEEALAPDAELRQEPELGLTVAQPSEVFAINDPLDPSREVLVEFIPESMAELIGRVDKTSPADAQKYGLAYDAIVGSIPAGIATAEQLAKAGQTVMRVVGPPEALTGLANGTMELVSSGGKSLGTVKDASTGLFSGQLRFDQVTAINPATAALVVFQVMALVSGQYFMKRIDKKLAEIDRKLTRVEGRLIGRTRAQLEVARELSERIFSLVKAGVMPTDQDLRDLADADQLVRLSFHEARDQFIVASREWKGFIDGDSDNREELHALIQAAEERRSDDAAILVYSTALSGRIGMLRLILESQGDPKRTQVLTDEYTARRKSMLSDLKAVRDGFKPLTGLTDKRIEERFEPFFGSTTKIKASRDRLKAATKDLALEVDGARDLIPTPPKVEAAPTVVEIRRNDTGEIEVATATLVAR